MAHADRPLSDRAPSDARGRRDRQPRPVGHLRGRGHRDRDRGRDLLRVLLLRLPAAGRRPVSTARMPPAGDARFGGGRRRRRAALGDRRRRHHRRARRDDDLHRRCTGRRCRRRAWRRSTRARCTSAGEFVESNLGTDVGADGKVTVRLVAQQYSFEPQCIVVPAEHAGHVPRHQHRRDPRLRRRHDQRQHDADPRLRRDVHDHVPARRASS